MNVFKSLTKKTFWSCFKPSFNSGLKLVRHGSGLVSIVEDDKLGTATLVLQRPPVNSLNLELLQEITSSIKELEKKRVRGFVLASGSPSVFSAGLDIMEMYKAEEQRFRSFWKSLQEMWKTLYLTPLVTIAAINGHAPAGGCMLALSCDYRIMLNGKITIGMNETQLGIAAPRWFQTLLVNAIGFRQTEKALSFGTLFTPEQALSLGLVDELASSKELVQEKALQQMAAWLKIPDDARRATKFGLRKPVIEEFSAYQEKELEYVANLFQSEGVQKPLEKYLEALKTRK